MNNYVTGAVIKALREKQGMTQSQLADKLCVSDKAVSKWETGKGFPDISLIEPLAKILNVSLPELLSGEQIINKNRSANILKSNIYVCPICGNILHSTGSAVVSCCGVALLPQEAETADGEHKVICEKTDGEYFITIDHPMTKEHYISFIAYCTGDRFETVKLYPEGSAQARFYVRGNGVIFWYCNHHGLFTEKIRRRDFIR